MNDVTKCRLSDEGTAKRDAILQNATAEMVKHHRARTRKRVAIATAAIIIIVGGGAIVTNQIAMTTTTTQPVGNMALGPNSASEPLLSTAQQFDSPAVEWRIVRSDSHAADQYKVQTASHIKRIDNAELADALSAINRPAGVITIDGRVRLTQNVVDEKTALDEGAPSSM